MFVVATLFVDIILSDMIRGKNLFALHRCATHQPNDIINILYLKNSKIQSVYSINRKVSANNRVSSRSYGYCQSGSSTRQTFKSISGEDAT